MHARKNAGARQMTQGARKRVKQELAGGDDLTNPEFLFSTTATTLLLAIADGMIDLVQLARKQLANRGLDADGDWVGFDRAREIHLGTQDTDHNLNQEDDR